MLLIFIHSSLRLGCGIDIVYYFYVKLKVNLGRFHTILFDTTSKKYKITLAALSSIFAFLFLLFFQPFGINNYRPDEQISMILVLALFAMTAIIFLFILICEFVIRPLLFKTNTLFKLVAWLFIEIIITCTGTFLVYNILGEFHDFIFSSYLKHLLELGTVLLFPFAATLFYFKHASVVKEYVDVLSLSNDSVSMQEIIPISGDYKNDQIALPLKAIVFFESEDNYVCLNYLEDLHIKKHLIRSTLSNLEQKLTSESFLRCSRSVIINLVHLESYKFDKKKLTLKLKSVPEPILVSSSRQNKIFSLIENKVV
jgi:hypothetical protein